MGDPLPKFDAPPVIETALSLQFSRLPGFSTAHIGWFWKSFLKPTGEWTKIVEAPRIDDQFERFGGEDVWGFPSVRLAPPGESQRVQIIRSDEARMVQVQDSRFVLNWRKQSRGYASYDVLFDEFRDVFQAFRGFVRDAGLGTLELNQWEITYVNQIPKGELWDSPRDWPKIIPGLYIPPVQGGEPQLETLSEDWRYVLKPLFGRLYVGLKHGRAPSVEAMILQLNARGPISATEGFRWEDGFSLAHEAIVRTFTAMTSPAAHGHWKRRA